MKGLNISDLRVVVITTPPQYRDPKIQEKSPSIPKPEEYAIRYVVDIIRLFNQLRATITVIRTVAADEISTHRHSPCYNGGGNTDETADGTMAAIDITYDESGIVDDGFRRDDPESLAGVVAKAPTEKQTVDGVGDGISIFELMREIPDEAAAEAHIAKVRWGDNLACPRCGSLAATSITTTVHGGMFRAALRAARRLA